MNGGQFEVALRKKISELSVERSNHILLGSYVTLPEYREGVGYLKALSDIMACVDEINKDQS